MSLRILLSRLITAFLLLLSACSKPSEPSNDLGPKVTGERIVFPDKSPQKAALTVEAVEPLSAELHQVTGRLIWNEDSTVRVYSPVAGRVRSLSAVLGEPIAKDGELVKLDSPDLGQAQSEFFKAQADLLLAERSLTRSKDLFEHGVVARKEMESAENSFSSAQSERQRAAARLTLYGASPTSVVDGIFTLRSPLEGIVVERNVNLGQEVRPDQMLANVPQLAAPLFVVSNPKRLSVLLDATEHDLAVLRPGIPFTVRAAPFPDRTFKGSVEWVSDAFDATTRRVTVRGVVDNADRVLKAEMFVTVDFELAGVSGVSVPSRAVIMQTAKHYVFVEEKSGTFVRREIEVGAEQNGKVVVRSGLVAGDRVVTDGSLLLEEMRGSEGSS